MHDTISFICSGHPFCFLLSFKRPTLGPPLHRRSQNIFFPSYCNLYFDHFQHKVSQEWRSANKKHSCSIVCQLCLRCVHKCSCSTCFCTVSGENDSERSACHRVSVQTTTRLSLPPHDTAATLTVGLQRLEGHISLTLPPMHHKTVCTICLISLHRTCDMLRLHGACLHPEGLSSLKRQDGLARQRALRLCRASDIVQLDDLLKVPVG